jgi:uncharacterized protein GlcG (DUF336 family)
MNKLTLVQAHAIIDAALGKAREAAYAPIAVVVLDDGGHVKAAAREDEASMFRFDVGLGKAWGAVAMGRSSRALATRAKENPNFIVALAATAHGRVLPQQGGVLIRDADGSIMGAVGISGATGDQDEECAIWGIEQAGLKADASA